MKLSDLIKELQNIRDEQPPGVDLEVYFQAPPFELGPSVGHEQFFVLAEDYSPEDGGRVVNLRTWPY